MTNKIKLLKPGDADHADDLERLRAFYEYLQGPGMNLGRKRAFEVIYYLQEHLPVFPDSIEKCSVCGSLFDTYFQGHHSEKNNKFYCYGCSHLSPD